MLQIEELPLTLGIHRTYKGYHFTVASLRLALENENNLLLFTKTIFPNVAKMYHTTVLCVERNIRTVIMVCWCSNCRETLINMAPYPLETPPTVGEFLDILLWHLKKNRCK